MTVGVPVGERPMWREVYDLLQQKQVGDLIDYEELSAALGRDIRKDRGPYFRATEEFLAVDHRALENVRNVGYRVVEARDHEILARRKHKTVRRGMRKVGNLIRNVDRSRLTQVEKERFDALELQVARQEDSIRRLEARTTKNEQAIQATQQQSTAVESRVQRLEQLLRDKGFEA